MAVMSRACLIAIACAAGLSVVAAACAGRGANADADRRRAFGHHSADARPRIDINPRPVYRRCASWYVIQYRPSGTVLFPEKHCWWQRG